MTQHRAPPRFLPEYDNLPLSHAGRGKKAHHTLLVDGFPAGLQKPDGATPVVVPFARLTGAQREAVAEEGVRMLTASHPGKPCDVRFGTVVPR
ncbi:hypothetical protein ACWELO_07130 [Streptomyces sp. NPDC004596]